MSQNALLGDLIVLVADKNMEFAVRGLLERPRSLGVRSLSTDVYVHPEKDPGCATKGEQFLSVFVRQYSHAVLMFDREGCGRQDRSREALEAQAEKGLSDSGWHHRAAAIVLDPELESWVWSDSPAVDAVLGWQGRKPALRTWLKHEGFLGTRSTKPDRPKEAMEKSLRAAKRRRSSALYFELAQRVGLRRCTDPAFLKFKTTLRTWFPAHA